MLKGILPLLFVLMAASSPDKMSGPELKTDDEKTLYALGLVLSRNLATFGLTEAELGLVKSGLTDGIVGKEKKVDLDVYGPKIQELARNRASVTAATEKKSAQAFLDKAAAEKGATKTTSGLIITEIKPGTGEKPKESDQVKVHYHGTLTDGTVFDSSVQRGEPAVFPLTGVIRCWTEGLQLIKVGGKSKLVCPSDLAYGDRGAPPQIKPGAALVFEVELLEIVKEAAKGPQEPQLEAPKAGEKPTGAKPDAPKPGGKKPEEKKKETP